VVQHLYTFVQVARCSKLHGEDLDLCEGCAGWRRSGWFGGYLAGRVVVDWSLKLGEALQAQAAWTRSRGLLARDQSE